MGEITVSELDLGAIRQQIDKVDHELAKVLEARLQLVMQVAEYKKSKGLPVKDAAREAQVISKVQGLLENQQYAAAVGGIMRSIIDAACELEEAALAEKENKVLQIGCFGVPGSFTHQALEEYFVGSSYERQHFNHFEEVVSAVSSGQLDYGVLPIENSSTGGITEAYDLLRKYDCSIVGERCIRIEQNLLGCSGASLQSITQVYSHPQGFAQSKEFFRDYPQMQQIPYFSTSKSAEKVADAQDITLGAVAGRKAAELYGLKVLAPAINYNSNNFTRFVVIARQPEKDAAANKITLITAVKHEAGSLYKLLGYFYHSGLNLMNLESRPMDGKSWEYFFYVDVTGNLQDNAVKDALEEVRKNCTYLKILGNYRADCRKE
jgi:chorismate mutase/prephenate dehydratase